MINAIKFRSLAAHLSQQKKAIPHVGVMCGVILTLLVGMSTPLAKEGKTSVWEVQRIETTQLKGLGVANPVGLMTSPNSSELIVFDRGQTEAKLTSINFGQFSVLPSISITTDLSDPINSAFDIKNNRILMLHANNDQLFEISANFQGEVDNAEVFSGINISTVSLLNKPQGMTINPETRALYILDSGKIVQISADVNSSELTDVQGSEIDLPAETGNAGEHRGIAFNINDGLLYVLNPEQQKLYSMTVSGLLQATYDVSEFAFSGTDAMTFSASGDSTDDSEQLSLYVIAQGALSKDRHIVELSLTKSTIEAEVSASDSVQLGEPSISYCNNFPITDDATLIKIIDTTNFDNPNPNPTPATLASPDPSGVTYILNQDVLWIDDGEVTETTGAPSDIYNIFEVNYITGALVAARTVRIDNGDINSKGFSDETTGASAINFVGTEQYMYISDDDHPGSSPLRPRIQELGPGTDLLYGTSDDVLGFTFNIDLVNNPGADPEGVAMGEVSPGNKVLFIADGVDNEIYKIDLGSNQKLDETDPVTSFDTNGHELKDPEGVAFNRRTGTVFVIGRANKTTGQFVLLELEVDGSCVQRYNLPADDLLNPAGLAFAPSSLNPAEMNIYIVDRGVDNEQKADENDGLVFEFDITPEAVVPRHILPHNEWQQISLPMIPPANKNTVLDVFGDDGLGTYGTHWTLYRYETSTNTYSELNEASPISQGVGYWIIQLTGTDKELYMPPESSTTPASVSTGCSGASCFQIPLDTKNGAIQWNMIGYPFGIGQSLSASRITASIAECTPSCTLDIAQDKDIVHDQLWGYNGSSYSVVDTTGDLDPWQSYWTATLNSADGTPVLLIPAP